MGNRAVLEYARDTDLKVSGDGLRVADMNHPDAVARLIERVRRGEELPLTGCCLEDLEAVRRHVAPEAIGRGPADVRLVPETPQEPREGPRGSLSGQRQDAPASDEPERARMRLIGLLPIVTLVVAVVWQLGLWGVTATLTSYAADEAAHAASLGAAPAEVRDDALGSVPSWFRSNMDVSQTSLGTVKVTSSMPVLAPILTVDGLDLTSEAPIVTEEG